jgi:protein-tyrosine phosphatase
MRPTIYWLDLRRGWRLAIMPRPRAGDWLDDEIAGWKAEGVDLVVGLLERQEIEELELDRLPASCRAVGIEYLSFPIADRGVPSSAKEADRLVRRICDALAAGNAVAVHCRAGIGRSSLIAACILVRNGYDVRSAFATIAEARGVEVPDTEAQRAWLSTFLAATAG